MSIDLNNGDCLDLMKNIKDKSIDMILCDYLQGMSLRRIAKKYNTNHHKIKRILLKNNIEIRKPKNTRGLRKYESNDIAKYANMKNHLRFDVELEWLLKFEDFEKLKFLNKQIINKGGNRFNEDSSWYKSYILNFYNEDNFNRLYTNYIVKNKGKYLKPSLDHIKPRSKGGDNEIGNLRFITYLENMCKKDISLAEWEDIKKRIGDYF